MRLPISKFYRAFPELDKFSDEQCERFVRNATTGSIGRYLLILLRAVATSIIAFVIALGLIGLFAPILSDLLKSLSFFEPVLWIVFVFAVIGIPVLCVMSGFLVRDYELRKAIWQVIDQHGWCAACRYSLLGLPLDQEFNVICPECGMKNRGHEALTALVDQPRTPLP